MHCIKLNIMVILIRLYLNKKCFNDYIGTKELLTSDIFGNRAFSLTGEIRLAGKCVYVIVYQL